MPVRREKFTGADKAPWQGERRVKDCGPLMVPKAPMSAIIRAAFFSAAFAGFVLATLLAWSPGLHEWAHADSGDAEHQCLATVLHSGACDGAAAGPPAVVINVAPVEASPRDCSRVAPSLFLSCRILEHAPPSLS
jgi:hypothetical protein